MAITGGYVACQAAKLTINSGTSTEASVKGLQGLTLPLGFTQTTQEVSVIGTRIATKYATGASYEDMNTNYYFAKGDPTQNYLAAAARNASQIQDMWFWMDSTDFAALDLITDPGGYVMVGTFSSPTANKNEIFSGQISIIIGGSHILFDTHISGTTLSFTAGGAGVSATATDSGSGFVTAGFEVGQTVIITGVGVSTAIYAKVKTVAAGTLTFEDAIGDEASIPTFSGNASTFIHAGTPIEVDTEF